jgi:hypothetical protein
MGEPMEDEEDMVSNRDMDQPIGSFKNMITNKRVLYTLRLNEKEGIPFEIATTAKGVECKEERNFLCLLNAGRPVWTLNVNELSALKKVITFTENYVKGREECFASFQPPPPPSTPPPQQRKEWPSVKRSSSVIQQLRKQII